MKEIDKINTIEKIDTIDKIGKIDCFIDGEIDRSV